MSFISSHEVKNVYMYFISGEAAKHVYFVGGETAMNEIHHL